ncbi:hypothetical protein A7L55_18705 [Acinetobacter baumannii]|nr:hypothetical protein A7L55_18705 [Acinetobacter baumannii]
MISVGSAARRKRAQTEEEIMEDYETEEKKQAAADVLFQYSQFAMACIGEGVHPSQLRIHLMKELSGMPTSLKKEQPPHPSLVQSPTPSPDRMDKPSSSSVAMERAADYMHS